MSPSFMFEPPSDEEFEHSEPEAESKSEEQESEGESGSEDEEEEPKEVRVSKKKTQSPWDFAKYSESVAEEHARRSTTSVDDKISKALRHTPVVALPDPEEESSSDSEPDKQVNFRVFVFHITYNPIHNR